MNHLVTAFTLITIVFISPALAAEEPKPTRGEDMIRTRAIGDGLCVHNLFQSNMVLQRDKPVRVWGWAAPGESVTVAFAGQTLKTTAGDDRAWAVMLPAMGANSSAQTLTVAGKSKTLTLDNVLVGDVWILGGQSNMEFPLPKVEHGELEIVSANYKRIRILTLPKTMGDKPRKSFARLHEWSSWSGRHFRKGDWDVCSPDTVRELSAIGFVFARRIHTAADIPIGVIDASVGGTTVETWTPEVVLRSIDTPEVKDLLARWDEKVATFDPKADLEARIKKHHDWVANMKKQGREVPANRVAPTETRPGPARDQNRPGDRYKNMMEPLKGASVKGAIFHQGFNNALGAGSTGAAMYYQVFGPMITAWRSTFNDPEMPFGIISLCTAGDMQTRDNYLEMMVDNGVYIREAQYKTFVDFHKADDKQIGFVSGFDQRRSWYHPQKKMRLGERAAAWAIATQYGGERSIRWLPPMVKEMAVENGRIVLRLDSNVYVPNGAPIEGFAIAGEDRKFQPAEAQWLEKDKDSRGRVQYDKAVVVLSSPHVSTPIHFRYAWGRNPLGNLRAQNNAIVPFATQRSDDWKIEETPLGGSLETFNSRQTQRMMRLEDMERRLKDAQRFIDEHRAKHEKESAASK